MINMLDMLKRYGDPGLIKILQIDLSPLQAKVHLEDTLLNHDFDEWVNPMDVESIENWIEWGKAYVDNIYRYGAPNSNMWAKRYWGTEGLGKTTSKCKIVGNVLTTRIQTRWDPPHKILMALSMEYPTISIYNKYKSEFWRGYLQAIYYGGTMADDIKI